MTPKSSVEDTDIAVIGMAGRFPGADSVDEFWNNLRHGRESVFPIAFAQGPLPRATGRKAVGGRLHAVEYFDAGFFGYSRPEAEITDPQHRLFLECAWEAMESAACVPERIDGDVGVFAGCSPGWYGHRLYAMPELVRSVGTMPLMIGNEDHFLAAKVSHKLDLRGPSLVIQTACSTSLVAIHYACQSILAGECDMALAGGVGLTFSADPVDSPGQEAILSGDGHCRAFDADAQGTLPGEGVAIVVLKRLSDAMRDGDPIRAVVKGSAVNNDGAGKASFAAPSVDGQARAIAQALAVSGISAETIAYVEAHGTATPLGDPIEVAALTDAFRRSTARRGFCGLGSVKTNIGHLDAAAGVAGFVKCVLALENELMPPSLHFNRPNPQIDFEDSPFFVVRQPTPWMAGAEPRRASVNACGFGGTNAHVVLEEAPALDDPRSTGSTPSPQLWVLSARSATALDIATDRLIAFIERHEAIDLSDAAYTLQIGRRAFAHRRFVVAATRAELIQALTERRVEQAICHGPALPALDAPSAALVDRLGALARSSSEESTGQRALWRQLGQQWLAGHDIDWAATTLRRGRRLAMPTYPFEREAYWVSASGPDAPTVRDGAAADHPEATNRERIEATVNAAWAEIMGTSGVDSRGDFFDAGGDSLMATQLLSRLRRSFAVELSLHGFFADPSREGVVAMIETRLGADSVGAVRAVPRITRAASRHRA